MPLSRTTVVDAVGLGIQDLHASGQLAGDQPLLRIDNRERARNAPFQFDAAKGRLHRTGCRAIPGDSESALYGLWEIKPEDFEMVLRANVLGTFLPIKYTLPHMVKRKSGKIVNISGTSGLRGYRYRTAYSASKLDGDVRPFIDHIVDEFAVADLVISRAGATTVAELAAAIGLQTAKRIAKALLGGIKQIRICPHRTIVFVGQHDDRQIGVRP